MDRSWIYLNQYEFSRSNNKQIYLKVNIDQGKNLNDMFTNKMNNKLKMGMNALKC